MLLDISPSTIVFTILNLLVLYLLMKLFLFKPVNAMLDKRAKMIEDSISQAQTQQKQAQECKSEYEHQLEQAQADAAKIVSQAKQRAQREYQQILARAQTDASKLIEDARTQMAAEREEMLQGARQQVAALALLAAAKVTQKTMDEKSDAALVNAFLSEAGDLR